MQEMTPEQYSNKCLDSIRLFITIYRTLLNTENQKLAMCSIEMLPTTKEIQHMFPRTKVPHFIKREDGLERRSNRPTDFQLIILQRITSDMYKLTRVTSKLTAKRLGLCYSEIANQDQQKLCEDENEIN